MRTLNFRSIWPNFHKSNRSRSWNTCHWKVHYRYGSWHHLDLGLSCNTQSLCLCTCRLSPFLVIRHTFQDGWTSKGGKSSNRSNISLTESEWRPSTHNDFWTTGLCHFRPQWCLYCNSCSLVDRRCHFNDKYNAYSWIIFHGFILLVLVMDLWCLFLCFVTSCQLFGFWTILLVFLEMCANDFVFFFIGISTKYPFCDWVNLACNRVSDSCFSHIGSSFQLDYNKQKESK